MKALLLDINMPGRSGLEALAELKKNRPELPGAEHVLRAGIRIAGLKSGGIGLSY
jgi:CheY-like chemotaxis protein